MGVAKVTGRCRNGVTAILKQSLEVGQPEELLNIGEDELFDFGLFT